MTHQLEKCKMLLLYFKWTVWEDMYSIRTVGGADVNNRRIQKDGITNNNL